MNPKYELCLGSACVSLVGIGQVLQGIYFAFAFIAAVTGAILGCHGLYQLMRHKLKG